MNQSLNQFFAIGNSEIQWKSIYILGGVAAILALTGLTADVAIANITGGNLQTLPQTAVARFEQFHQSRFAGLYNLDLLNLIVQVIMIPVYFALYAAHRQVNRSYSMLALLFFLSGSVIMVSNNTALPMMDLSNKYFASADDSQKLLYAAAGESLLARGAHGSPGIFPGFFIPNIAGLIISIVMLKGGVFTKMNSWAGITGSVLMMFYIIVISFIKDASASATALAMPGGLLLMTWMILFTIRLFSLADSSVCNS